MSNIAHLVDDVDHFQRRLIQDALAEASVGYWRRRAAAFDKVGTAACDEIAQACRNRAEFILMTRGEDQ